MDKIIILGILIGASVLAYFLAKQHENDDPFFF